jgi:hypothetical protein
MRRRPNKALHPSAPLKDSVIGYDVVRRRG